MINKQSITKISDYDEWRDIAFYNYVKEHILKKKVCPNFIIMYGYNITLKANINFEELKQIQLGVQQNRVSQTNSSVSNKNVVIIRDPLTGQIKQQIVGTTTKQEQSIMVNKYYGKALVCLTESPHYTIMRWAKKEYKTEKNIRTMINLGHHSRAIWESIIFQLLVALYVMQIKGIIINKFKLDRNVFIKDMTTGGNVTNYWKYKVNGIDYYIPNYGYILLIDTNFRDIEDNIDEITETMDKRVRKLDGKFLDGCKLTNDEIMNKSFDTFRTAIDPNQFDNNFLNNNGVKPPDEIIFFLKSIKDLADSKPSLDIAYYIRTFMTMFMNNRIGGALNETEITNVKRGAIKKFRNGQIVVMTDHDGIEKFVLHVKMKDANISIIITKDSLDPEKANIIEKEVSTSSLNEYSILEPIKQNFKMNLSNLNEESLLETYTVE